ncbi:MAG: glycosyltransferase [Limimaricola sp.]|uniref:glycosyltransferase family 4 protein n=1 Tax=Limimaricola sp. TaxID=2211665 RepID=UPI001DF801B3|nr:glycosyltransferase family 4 protein [Limimaricola sp.]MBI1417274.1 glycosyltransferase [Limimaricola sp.]
MTDGPSPAIFFHADAVETAGKDLVGRRAAGQSFLRAFLQHVPGSVVNAVTATPDEGQAFVSAARDLGETREIAMASLRRGDFTRFGTVFFPVPGFVDAPWRRLQSGTASCSLVGVTHTVSTRRVIENLHHLVSEPVEPWDAIICTSHAVKSVVSRQFAAEEAFFRDRFGAKQVPLPQLPVISLGLHSADFAADPAHRAEARARFGAPDDAIVVLTVGRFTSVEKASPGPLFLALEKVATELGRPLHLWMTGWASRKPEEVLHKEGAAALAPNVTTTMIDGRDPWVRRWIWSGADIFTLPADNVQETFGLVPVEAMGAGLPVVMPDWDGFKDTVLHGQTGFLVPTRMPPPGTGRLLAKRFAEGSDDYLRYLSLMLQQTQIDIPAYAESILTLARDPELRRRMGAAGVAHIRKNFDWAAIIPRYLALAAELAEMRAKAPRTSGRLSSPIEIDPYTLYADYPTGPLLPEALITPRHGLTTAGLARLDRFSGRALYGRKVVADALLLQIAALLERSGPQTVAALTEAVGATAPQVTAAVLFLAKFDIVQITDADGP